MKLPARKRTPVVNPVRFLRQGYHQCPKCEQRVPLADHEPLSFGQCPNCDESFLVPLRIAGFWLHAPLGAGAMGSVYKAYHEDHGDSEFAVKVLPRGERDNPELVEAISRETEACAAISGCPCLVNVAGGGYEDGEYFLAMEFVGGERLDLRIERLGRVPVNDVLFIGLRLVTALAHIYNRGYLYRDLKPENVIMTEHQGAILFDYGLCIPTGEAGTPSDSDSVQGTPLYLPPERLLGEGEHARSEIYSLGMVLFHAATGHTYVDVQLSVDELKAVLKQHLSVLRSGAGIKEILDRDLQQTIGKMIEREPHRRYQTYVEAERGLLQAIRNRLRSDKYGRLVGV